MINVRNKIKANASCKIDNCCVAAAVQWFLLTISVFSEMLRCWLTRLAPPCLVDRPDSPLVELALLEAPQTGLADWPRGLLDRNKVQVVFPLLLQEVVSDGPPPV